MEHAQVEVSWLHPSEGLSLYKTIHYTIHLVVSIHYTIHLVVSIYFVCGASC